MSVKDAYQSKLQAQLDRWKAEIDRLKAEVDSKEADARVAYHKQLEDVTAKRDAVEAKLKELVQAGDGALEDMKTGLETMMKDLESTLDTSVSRFK